MGERFSQLPEIYATEPSANSVALDTIRLRHNTIQLFQNKILGNFLRQCLAHMKE